MSLDHGLYLRAAARDNGQPSAWARWPPPWTAPGASSNRRRRVALAGSVGDIRTWAVGAACPQHFIVSQLNRLGLL